MADSRCEELLKITDAAFERFRPYRQLCQDIALNFYPMRADFTTTLNVEDFEGDLMDGTPVNARETLGNAIDAMLRQGSEWFHIGTGNTDRDKRPQNATILNRVTNDLRSVLMHPGSNWKSASKEWDMDWVSFGSWVGSIEESRRRTHIVFKPWHLRDCAWLLDEDGRVDMFTRNLQLTARDIMRKFNEGKWTGTVAPAIREAAQREPLREFPIRHILMTTEDLYATSAGDIKRIRHPYISIYIDRENHDYLNEAGSPVFNYVVGRNRVLSGRPWGFSPMALNSLPDARMLQDMALVVLEQGQKAVDPPTIGAGNVFVRDMNFYAGGHTEVDLDEGQKLGDVFTTIETGRVDVGLQLKADVRMLISEAWLLNSLTLPTLRDMRELEVQVRTDEFRRAALPFFSPIDTNYHGELLGTVWDVAVNAGAIRPQISGSELDNKGIQFTFESPLNEVEGMAIVRKYYESVNIIATGASVDKTVANIYDLRTAAEEALSRGTKPEWVIPEDQREQADKQANIVSGLTQAADIARQGAGVTADVANATMAAQNAGLAPPPG